MRYYFEKPRKRSAPSSVIKRVLVRCPATSKLTPTGRTTDESRWSAAKVPASELSCPHCNQVHTWTKKDAILAR